MFLISKHSYDCILLFAPLISKKIVFVPPRFIFYT